MNGQIVGIDAAAPQTEFSSLIDALRLEAKATERARMRVGNFADRLGASHTPRPVSGDAKAVKADESTLGRLRDLLDIMRSINHDLEYEAARLDRVA